MDTIPLIMDMVSILSTTAAGILVVYFVKSIFADKKRTIQNNF
ncbi:hypothetical protein [Nitrosopumilus sp. Nsub]|nr:hypothetical protein [Nitrosopumilus sp. Nsub]